jgi:serine phosphatase RsbU (regulator of sigma subunit)
MLPKKIKIKIEYFQKRLAAAPSYLRYATLAFMLLGTTVMQIFATFGDTSGLDQRVIFPFLFNAREKISPRKIDPRIKIFALDDQSYGYLKGDDIPLSDWARVFQSISKTPDVKIVVDKLFSKHYSAEEIKEFGAIMDAARPRVSIISYSYPDAIRFRSPISAELIKNSASNLLEFSDDFNDKLATNYQAYGATAPILEKFTHFGHAEYNGFGRILAARTLEENTFLPFTSLTIAKKIKFEKSRITADGHDIHVNSSGEFIPNFAPRQAFAKNSFAFMTVVARVKKGLDLSIIKPGDVVVILPAMYTGNTDFKSTPFGNLPGGLILSAVIDSVFSNRWISYAHDPGFILLLLGICIFVAGCFVRPWVAAVLIFLLVALVLVISILSFVFADVIIPFVFPIVSIIVGGASALTISAAANESEERRIKREVEVATLVQRSFLRNGTLNLGESLTVTGNSQPASECGGDWWGAFHRHGYSYVIIGDAVGHGVPAALVTAVGFSVTRMVHEELGVLMPPSIEPTGILKRINAILCDMGTDSAFMTFQIMRINDTTGECLYANAGNVHPVLIPSKSSDDRLSKDQRIKTLIAPGEPLGSSADVEYQNHKITLRPGDHVVMYTDGLIENAAERSEAPGGKAWLKKTLSEVRQDKVMGLHEQIWESYQRRIGKNMPADDATLVTFYRTISSDGKPEIIFE